MRKTAKQRYQEGQPLYKSVQNTRRSWDNYVSRIKKRIERLLELPHSYFVTFTISPEHYGNEVATYIRSIKKALGGAVGWLFNVDYGTMHGRLHFHAVAGYTEQLDYSILLEYYKYGAINIKPIIQKDEKSLREYLLKVVNHTIKGTAGTIYRSRTK